MIKRLIEQFSKFDEYELNTLEIEKKAHYAKDNYYANFNVIGFANDDDASIVKGTVTHYIDEWYYEDRIYDCDHELSKAWKEMYGIENWSNFHILRFSGRNCIDFNLDDFSVEYCVWAFLRLLALEMQQFPAYKEVGIALRLESQKADGIKKVLSELIKDDSGMFYDWLHADENALHLTFRNDFKFKKLGDGTSVICMMVWSSRFEANIDLEDVDGFVSDETFYDFNGIGSTWY